MKIIYSDRIDDEHLKGLDATRMNFNLSDNTSKLEACDVLIYGNDKFNNMFLKPVKFSKNCNCEKFIFKCDWEGGFNLPIDRLDKRRDELKYALNCDVIIVTQNESLTRIDSKFRYLHRSWVSPHAWGVSGWSKEFAIDNFKLSDQPIFKFNYFHGTPRADKIAMLNSLQDNNLLNDEICVWSKFGKDINLSRQKQENQANQSQGKMEISHKGKPVTLSELYRSVGQFYTSLSEDFLDYNNVYSIHNSRFSLVQETEMRTTTNRYTEKTIKAVQTKQIFILAGNYHTLKLLRQDGFKTFDGIIDESYDNIEDRDSRIQAITKEVKRLCNISNEEWIDIYNSAENILNYNLNHLKTLHVKYKTELLNIINE